MDGVLFDITDRRAQEAAVYQAGGGGRARLTSCAPHGARIVEAADAERRRIERDLHDGAQQRLLAVAMDLRHAAAQAAAGEAGARRRSPRPPPSSTVRRAISASSRAACIRPSSPSAGWRSRSPGLVRRAPLPVDTAIAVRSRLAGAVEAAAYFLVAEALTNVARYAQATAASVTIAMDGDALRVEVADDGHGGARLEDGTGLRGLADRLAVLDGTLSVDSPPGAGTRVVARIPR